MELNSQDFKFSINSSSLHRTDNTRKNFGGYKSFCLNNKKLTGVINIRSFLLHAPGVVKHACKILIVALLMIVTSNAIADSRSVSAEILVQCDKYD